MDLVVLAFALWFILEALKAGMSLARVVALAYTFAIFVYCPIVGLYLIYANGGIAWHHGFR
jgi:hypothetical protein